MVMIHRNPEAKIRRFALRPYDTAGYVRYCKALNGFSAGDIPKAKEFYAET